MFIYIPFSLSADHLFISVLGHGRHSADVGRMQNRFKKKMPEFIKK